MCNRPLIIRLCARKSNNAKLKRAANPKHSHIIKYICLGYIEPDKFESMSESDRNAMLDECFSYDDVLRNGKVSITDGPYAETKEQLGGILILEARDLNHAIQLMSKHPGVKAGPFEIRPAADLTEMIRESKQRRGAG
jgi:hypothetical protein